MQRQPPHVVINQFPFGDAGARLETDGVVRSQYMGGIVPVNARNVSASMKLLPAQGGLKLMGFALAETTAVNGAKIVIHNGEFATSDPSFTITMLPNESVREWYWPGLDWQNGVFIEVINGSVDICVYIGM